MLQFNARQSSLMQALIYFIKVVCIITLKSATAATIHSLLLMVGKFYKVIVCESLVMFEAKRYLPLAISLCC